jgi:hypothetical protein
MSGWGYDPDPYTGPVRPKKGDVRIEGMGAPLYVSQEEVDRIQSATPWWAQGWVIFFGALVLFAIIGAGQ